MSLLYGQRYLAVALVKSSNDALVTDTCLIDVREGRNRRFQNFTQTRQKGYDIEDLSDYRYVEFLYR